LLQTPITSPRSPTTSSASPTVPDYVSPILTVIPLQLLAYHLAVELDRDVDKSRNLAKSVTVE
jgi:glucosamine--fructose-6-phosphate aminotransferase (isomerizing)